MPRPSSPTSSVLGTDLSFLHTHAKRTSFHGEHFMVSYVSNEI